MFDTSTSAARRSRSRPVSSRRRAGWWGGAAALVLVATLIVFAGCTARIVPPAPAEVSDPQMVYLLDHGRTSSLVLPTNGMMVRYAYGEYQWYALERTGVLRVFPALFWPTPATLGQKLMPGPVSPEMIQQQVLVGIEAIHAVEVDAARVRSLLDRLERRFEAGAAEREVVVAPVRDLQFVPTSPRYHVFYNSNHVAAEWLEALGCTVRGPTILSRWRVEPPPD